MVECGKMNTDPGFSFFFSPLSLLFNYRVFTARQKNKGLFCTLNVSSDSVGSWGMCDGQRVLHTHQQHTDGE